MTFIRKFNAKKSMTFPFENLMQKKYDFSFKNLMQKKV